MELLEPIIRSAAIGQLLFVSLIFVRDYRSRPVGMLGALFCVSLATFLSKGIFGQSLIDAPQTLFSFHVLLASANPLFFWAFARAVFDDSFRLKPIHFVVFAICMVFYLAGSLVQPQDFQTVQMIRAAPTVLTTILDIHVLVFTIRTHRSDLIAERREFRTLLLCLGPLFGLTYFGTKELSYLGFFDFSIVSIYESTGAFVLIWLLGTALLRVAPRAFSPPNEQSADVARDETGRELTGPDQAIVRRLFDLMDLKSMHRLPGLSVRKLASAMGLPEHQLRKIINTRLGFRNFAQFLNNYRIRDACKMLLDPKQPSKQVLLIAYDVGYGSLTTFNRAFKEVTGLTPSQYRAEQCATNDRHAVPMLETEIEQLAT